MLAKELKIKNIKRQREFIQEQIEKMLKHPNEDGNTAYPYVGYVFPEVIDYFKGEGFAVKRVNSEMLIAATKGVPAYLFIVSDEVKLSEEEMKEAEEVEYELDEDDVPDAFDDMMTAFFGSH